MSTNYSTKRLQDYIEKYKRGEKVDKFLQEPPTTLEESKLWDYTFWKTQPVTQLDTIIALPRVINSNLVKSEEVIRMIKPYEWFRIDINNDSQMNDVVTFLNKYYVADKNKNKCYNQVFTKEYLRWELGDRAYINCIMPYNTDTSKIGGVICATVREMQLFNLSTDVAYVTHMCLHPKLRDNRLTELFVQETVRQMGTLNCQIGYFTTTNYVPTPVCRSDIYYRPINYEKLYNNGFVRLDKDKMSDLPLAIAEYTVNKAANRGVKLTEQYVEAAYELVCNYQEKYNLYEKYTLEQFIKTFLDNSVVSSYVILNSDDEVLDFYSYVKYDVKSLTKQDVTINCARMHLYTSTEITPLTIFKSAIISASLENVDMLVCTEVMENMEVVYDNVNKFLKNTMTLGSYQYYNFYNWECPELSPEQVCLY